MTHLDDIQIDRFRFQKTYDRLVDETENRANIYDRAKRQRLADLLELFEYLRGEDEANPLDTWFKD